MRTPRSNPSRLTRMKSSAGPWNHVAIIRPSSCQTVRNRSQSPASRQTTQFSTSSRIVSGSARAAAILALRDAGLNEPRDDRIGCEPMRRLRPASPSRRALLAPAAHAKHAACRRKAGQGSRERADRPAAASCRASRSSRTTRVAVLDITFDQLEVFLFPKKVACNDDRLHAAAVRRRDRRHAGRADARREAVAAERLRVRPGRLPSGDDGQQVLRHPAGRRRSRSRTSTRRSAACGTVA